MSTPLLSRILAAMGRWVSRERRRRLSEAGYAAVMVAVVVPTIGIGCAAVAVDTGMWYVEIAQVQKAADAAALAGVPYLPQDLPSARARALEVAARNGYNNTGNNTVTVGLGEKATQLRVEIRSTITNTFGTVIGVPKQTITRAATADYQGPAPMGSPCNTFGNEPNAGTAGGFGHSRRHRQGRARSPTACARRSSGPRSRGRRPARSRVTATRPRTAAAASTGARAAHNDEYDEFGYVFVVKVGGGRREHARRAAALRPDVRQHRADVRRSLPDQSLLREQQQQHQPLRQEQRRHGTATQTTVPAQSSFCNGDSVPPATARELHGTAAPDDHLVRAAPADRHPEPVQVAPVQNDTSGSPCIKQYGAYNTGGANISANCLQERAQWLQRRDRQPVPQLGQAVQVHADQRSATTTCRCAPTSSLGGSGPALHPSGQQRRGGRGRQHHQRRGDELVRDPGRDRVRQGEGGLRLRLQPHADLRELRERERQLQPDPGAAGCRGPEDLLQLLRRRRRATGRSVQVLDPPDATGTITSTPFPGGCTADGGSAGANTGRP